MQTLASSRPVQRRRRRRPRRQHAPPGNRLIPACSRFQINVSCLSGSQPELEVLNIHMCSGIQDRLLPLKEG